MISVLVTIGTLVSAAASVPYILAVIRGTVRPRLVSWAVWAVLAGVMTVSAFAEGAMASAVMTLITFIACATITILGWRRRSRDGMSRLDIVCLVGAAVGIASLVVFKNPLIALGVSVAVDSIAFIPTLIHAWVSPHEESLACFGLSATGGILAVMAVIMGDISLAALLYPVYSMVFNSVAALLIVGGRGKLLLGHQQYYGEEA